MKAKIILLAAFCAVCLNMKSDGLTITNDPDLRKVVSHMWAGAPLTGKAQQLFQHNPVAKYRNYYYTSFVPITETRAAETALARLEMENSKQVYKDTKALAEKEGMKFTSRQFALQEKAVEEDKIDKKTADMEKLISTLGKYDHAAAEDWEARFNAIHRTAPKIIQDAYMPIGSRKEAYNDLYTEASGYIKNLSKEVIYYYDADEIKRFASENNFRNRRFKPSSAAGKVMAEYYERVYALNGTMGSKIERSEGPIH